MTNNRQKSIYFAKRFSHFQWKSARFLILGCNHAFTDPRISLGFEELHHLLLQLENKNPCFHCQYLEKAIKSYRQSCSKSKGAVIESVTYVRKSVNWCSHGMYIVRAIKDIPTVWQCFFMTDILFSFPLVSSSKRLCLRGDMYDNGDMLPTSNRIPAICHRTTRRASKKFQKWSITLSWADWPKRTIFTCSKQWQGGNVDAASVSLSRTSVQIRHLTSWRHWPIWRQNVQYFDSRATLGRFRKTRYCRCV